MLRINIDATPNTAVDFTPTIGGTGGGAFQLSCAADETLVGVHGRSATYVNRSARSACKVDQFGHWIGDPVKRARHGHDGDGHGVQQSLRARLRDERLPRPVGARTSISSNSQCRALTAFGGLTGTGTFLGADGGTGGTAQALQALRHRAIPSMRSTGDPAAGSTTSACCAARPITPISVNSRPSSSIPAPRRASSASPSTLPIPASDGDGDPLTFSATRTAAGPRHQREHGPHHGRADRRQALRKRSSPSATARRRRSRRSTGRSRGNAPLVRRADAAAAAAARGCAGDLHGERDGRHQRRYKWYFDDGTPETAYSTSPTITHTFARPASTT